MAFDRAKERAAISMAIAEDDQVFAVIAAAAALAPNTTEFATASTPVVRSAFADLYAIIAGRQLIPSAYLVNAKRYGDILRWAASDIDQVSLNVIVETGQFGVLFGTRLIISTRLPYAKLYCATTPDKIGRIPERKAVEVKIFDNVQNAEYNIVGWEQIGIGCHNIAGIARCDIT